MNKIDKAVEELNEYLDTFYTDSEGWMELADIYSSCHQSVVSLHFITPFKIGKLSRGLLDTLMLFKHSHMHFFCLPKILLHFFNLPKLLIRQETCPWHLKCS